MKRMKPVKAWAYVDERGGISYSGTNKALDGTYRLQPDVYLERKSRCYGEMPQEFRLVRVEIREVE